MGNQLESLVIDLRLETGELSKGLEAAQAQLSKFGDKLDDLAGVITFEKIGGAAKEAASKLVDFALRGAQIADQTGKMAQAVGQSTEEFSRLSYAAGLSGVGTSELASALNHLNKGLAEAGTGSKEQVALFQALGVSVTDSSGKVRGAGAVLGDLAEKFAGMENGASKAKLASDLFGRQLGAQMIPFLNQGREGIASLEAEADRLGITIGGEAAQAAERFNDNMEKLQRAADGVAVKVAAELTPALSDLTDQFIASDQTAKGLTGTVETLATGLKVLASGAVGILGALDLVGTGIAGALASSWAALTGNMREAASINDDLNDKLSSKWRGLKQQWDAIWGTGLYGKPVLGPEAPPKQPRPKFDADGAARAAEAAKKALAESEQAMKQLSKMLIDMESKAAQVGMGPIEAFEQRLQSGDIAEQLKKIGGAADEMGDKLRAAFLKGHDAQAALLADSLDFGLKQSARETKRDVNARELAFNTVGSTPRQAAQTATGGFASFDQALKAMAAETNRSARMLASAQQLQFEGDMEGARWAQEQAANAKAAADAAGIAADGFQSLAEIDFSESQQAIQNTLNGLGSLGMSFAKNLGDLGDVINAGVQGAQSGGVWGAIIGVVIELMSKFEGFGQILDIANGAVKFALGNLSQGFGDLIQSLRPLFGAVSTIAGALHGIIGPILSVLGKALERLAPMFLTIGTVIGIIGSTLQPVFSILGGIFDMLKIFNPILAVVTLSMMGLKLGIEYVVLGFQMFLDFVARMFGGNNQGGVDSAQAATQKTIKEMEALAKQLEKDPFNAVTNYSNDLADNLEDLGASTEKTSTEMNKLSAAFQNVPETFKMALRRYQSTDPDHVATFGSINPRPPNVYNITAQGHITTENRLADLVSERQRQQNYARDGFSPP